MPTANQLDFLIQELLQEHPDQQRFARPQNEAEKRRLLRALMNARPPQPISAEWMSVQDQFLQAEAVQKGIVMLADVSACPHDQRLILWQGDITRLQVDAIVNAANDALLGCFVPCHGCIDNAIHAAAGLQLRQACQEIMARQGHPEPTGRAQITPAYNLPSCYVLHTVGPIIGGPLTAADRGELADCYRSCLELAAAHSLESVAFCCISTGEFRFPNRAAAEIAIQTVRDYLNQHKSSVRKVIFNVYQDEDRAIYEDLLGLN